VLASHAAGPERPRPPQPTSEATRSDSGAAWGKIASGSDGSLGIGGAPASLEWERATGHERDVMVTLYPKFDHSFG
jgi:hypothetical protein